MEDDQNGRLPKWKMIKMEEDQNGRCQSALGSWKKNKEIKK